MAEDLHLATGIDKAEKYTQLLPQIEALIRDEPSYIANLSNISAALKQAFDFWWVGFYLAEGNELVLGPFQGPVACTRIASGKGVCGTAMAQKESILVPDVDAFPGHIACSSASRSEIVVPVLLDGEVLMILDVDSEHLNHFDATDKKYLEALAEMISKYCHTF